jgi:HrpA-like RNA helicase
MLSRSVLCYKDVAVFVCHIRVTHTNELYPLILTVICGTARQQDYDGDDYYDGENPYAFQIGGRPRKGDIDYDLLTKLVMVLARGALRDADIGGAEGAKELAGMFAPAHGSILVFMPGVPEIARLSRLLEAHYKSTSSSGTAGPRLKIIPLHGNLSPTEQKVVFKDAAKNEIKIVIATNVAEASVTIPDVTVVIDTCRVKEISFDVEIQTSALMMKFAAQDSLRQRRGRAGKKRRCCFRNCVRNMVSVASRSLVVVFRR